MAGPGRLDSDSGSGSIRPPAAAQRPSASPARPPAPLCAAKCPARPEPAVANAVARRQPLPEVEGRREGEGEGSGQPLGGRWAGAAHPAPEPPPAALVAGRPPRGLGLCPADVGPGPAPLPRRSRSFPAPGAGQSRATPAGLSSSPRVLLLGTRAFTFQGQIYPAASQDPLGLLSYSLSSLTSSQCPYPNSCQNRTSADGGGYSVWLGLSTFLSLSCHTIWNS